MVPGVVKLSTQFCHESTRFFLGLDSAEHREEARFLDLDLVAQLGRGAQDGVSLRHGSSVWSDLARRAILW